MHCEPFRTNERKGTNRLRPRIQGALGAADFYTFSDAVRAFFGHVAAKKEWVQSNLRSSSVSPVKFTLRVGSFFMGSVLFLRFFMGLVCHTDGSIIRGV